MTFTALEAIASLSGKNWLEQHLPVISVIQSQMPAIAGCRYASSFEISFERLVK